MSRRLKAPLLSRSFKRTLGALSRMAIRAGTKAAAQVLRSTTPAAARKAVPKKRALSVVKPRADLSTGMAGGLQYRLFVPADLQRGEPLPLLVMLHGCGQDAQSLAASTRMNLVAARERFLVLYPEQSRLSNLQGCWNWFRTHTGLAQAEADAVLLAVEQVCRTQAVDPDRMALAGLSAGAGLAALVATRHPQRFRAIAMHSGIAPGLAHSTASALGAMRGLGTAQPLVACTEGDHLPALLVIQGQADTIVAPANGGKASQLWAASEGAAPGLPRTVQRGARYAITQTDFYTRGRLVTTLCEIEGLGHAWSGGAASQAYSDPKGPDASRMIWAFAARQFAKPSVRHISALKMQA